MADTTFELAYGDTGVTFNLEGVGRCEAVTARPLPALSDPREAILDALRHPIGSPPLREAVARGDTVALLTPDISRVAHSHVYLPIIVEELTAAGVREDDITVIFARGTHRKHSQEEQKRLAGELWGRISALDHDPTESENVLVGATSRGTQVRINPIVAAADRVIGTGAIVYHCFAGFGGGCKIILPGVASFETVMANHKLTLNPGAGSGRTPAASTGVLRGNPVHEDMEEAAAMVGPAFLFNVVVNDDNELAGVFAGHWQQAHAAGARFVDSAYRVDIREQADLVIVSAGGYPKDIDYYQAYKAVDNAAWAVRDKGTIILVAECRDGIGGHGGFEEWLGLGSIAVIERRLRERYEQVGLAALDSRRQTERLRIVVLSSLPDEDVRALHMIPARDPREALALASDTRSAALRGGGANPGLTYVMPQGYVTFPVVGG